MYKVHGCIIVLITSRGISLSDNYNYSCIASIIQKICLQCADCVGPSDAEELRYHPQYTEPERDPNVVSQIIKKLIIAVL